MRAARNVEGGTMTRHQKRLTAIPSVFVMLFVFLTFAVAAPVFPEDSVEAQALVDKARGTFDIFVADQGMTWLHEHLKEAKGVLIIPQMLKAGFFLGASGGSGVLLVRDDSTRMWSDPAFYNIGSVSLGLQIGASAAEVVMLLMTQNAVDALLTTRIKLGGDVSAAIGPVGAGAAAKGIMADIISFAKTKGAYIGLSVEGAVIDTADSVNSAYYGKQVMPADILIKHEVSNPKSSGLRSALNRAAK